MNLYDMVPFFLLFLLWRELKVVDVGGDHLSVDDEESLAVDHVRDHHDLVKKNRRFIVYFRVMKDQNVT